MDLIRCSASITGLAVGAINACGFVVSLLALEYARQMGARNAQWITSRLTTDGKNIVRHYLITTVIVAGILAYDPNLSMLDIFARTTAICLPVEIARVVVPAGIQMLSQWITDRYLARMYPARNGQ